MKLLASIYADKDIKKRVFKEWIYFLRMLYNKTKLGAVYTS